MFGQAILICYRDLVGSWFLKQLIVKCLYSDLLIFIIFHFSLLYTSQLCYWPKKGKVWINLPFSLQLFLSFFFLSFAFFFFLLLFVFFLFVCFLFFFFLFSVFVLFLFSCFSFCGCCVWCLSTEIDLSGEFVYYRPRERHTTCYCWTWRIFLGVPITTAGPRTKIK